MKLYRMVAIGTVAALFLSMNVSAGFFSDIAGASSSTEAEESNDSAVEITICDEYFSSEDRACFLIYQAVTDAGRQLGYIVQNHNPELSFVDDLQSIDTCRLYLSYYGQSTKEEAQILLESYTSDILVVLRDSFPKVEFDTIDVYWEVPAIDEGNLYAATYRCEKDKDSGEIVRGDGSGKIYD